MPIIFVPRAIMSLVSLLILAAAGYLIWSWFNGYDLRGVNGARLHEHGPSWRLYVGGGLLAWSLLGRAVVLALMPAGQDEPHEERSAAQTLTAPDGSVLHVEITGQPSGPTIVLTHGWGLNSTAWWYTKHALQGRFRIVTWDLPGLGRSKPPRDGRFTIDRFAEALGTVVESVAGAPIVLVGHSIGGMTTQTFWRACNEATRAKVSGVVLVDTTYQDPITTMWLSPLWRALRWPMIEPMMWLMIALTPSRLAVQLAKLSQWVSPTGHAPHRLRPTRHPRPSGFRCPPRLQGLARRSG